MSIQQQFEAALKVIQNLPKDGNLAIICASLSASLKGLFNRLIR